MHTGKEYITNICASIVNVFNNSRATERYSHIVILLHIELYVL